MEQSKRNRGARSGWPLTVPRKLIAGLALAGAAAWPGMTLAADSCGGGISHLFVTPPTPVLPRFVGDTLRIKSTLVNNETTSAQEIASYKLKLDCANAGDFGACVDEGEVMNFVGYVSTTCQDVGNADVTWTPVVAGNLVTFTPGTPVVLDALDGIQPTCDVVFDVQIASLSLDDSPNLITAADQTVGNCEGFPGGANGSVGTAVETCGITLKKQVLDPDTLPLAWLDADNAENGDGEDLLTHKSVI
jgi:hypothetical protein